MAEERQPTLTLYHVSYLRGEMDGRACVIIYDSATDETKVIAAKSKGYDSALAAIALLEALSVPDPKLKPKSILHNVRKPKLILPGSNANN